MISVDFTENEAPNAASLAKKKQFEDLLLKQEEERQNFKEQKKIRNENEKDPKERMLTVQSEFRTQYDAIQDMIKKFNKATSNISEFFTAFGKLKEFFVTSNYALTTYDKQQYKEQLEKMERTIFQARDLAKPRNKFRFSQDFKKSANQNASVITEEQGTLAQRDFGEDIPGLVNLKDQEITIEAGKPHNYFVQSSTIRLQNIENCVIVLEEIFDTIYIKNIVNSIIKIGPVKFSILIDGCINSQLFMCAQQLRIHNSKNTQFSIISTSKSIIEHCTNLTFSPYSHKYNNFEQQLIESGLKGKDNLWRDIQDFNWHKQEASPNFVLTDS